MGSKITSKLFRKIDVWKRDDGGTLIIYSCFHLLDCNKYCVQSANFYNNSVTKKQIESFKQQELELFLDVSPDERSELYDTIEKAIDAHDKEFQ